MTSTAAASRAPLRSRPRLKAVGWLVMTLLAVAIAGYAVVNLLLPGHRSEFVQKLFQGRALAAFAHLAGGPVALVAGGLQMNRSLRTRFIDFHRWSGRIYLSAVLIGGLAGLALAVRSFGGMVTHLGFGALAVCWLGTSLMALRRILAGDVTSHQRWMIRSYALTLAAVTLRVYIPLSQAAGIPFEPAYKAISWLAWVPNLLLAELFVSRVAPGGREYPTMGPYSAPPGT